jgi:hypothetical protein
MEMREQEEGEGASGGGWQLIKMMVFAVEECALKFQRSRVRTERAEPRRNEP